MGRGRKRKLKKMFLAPAVIGGFVVAGIVWLAIAQGCPRRQPAWLKAQAGQSLKERMTRRAQAGDEDAKDGGSQATGRCNPVMSKSLRLMKEDEEIWVRTNDEIMAAADRFDAPERGKFARNGLVAIRDLLPADLQGIEAVDVVPCNGDPYRYSVSDLDARKIVVTTNKRGILKLVDLSRKDNLLTKNLFAVRLITAGSKHLEGPVPGFAPDEGHAPFIVSIPREEDKPLTRTKIRPCGPEGCRMSEWLPPDYDGDWCLTAERGPRIRMRQAIALKSTVAIPERGPGLVFYVGGLKGSPVYGPLTFSQCRK